MKKTVYRVKHLLQHPTMILHYGRWFVSTRLHGHPPIIRPYQQIQLGNWNNFTEYWLNREGLPQPERALIQHCRELSSSSVALDVGANLGMFSLGLASSGFTTVQAFEPASANFERLKQTMKLNPSVSERITVHQMALGDAEGAMEFVVYPDQLGTCKFASAKDVNERQQRISVPVTTLNAFCRNAGLSQIGFLKIDVEGFEPMVLRGASELLASKSIQFLYLEVIPLALTNAGFSCDLLYDLLAGFGYFPHLTDGNGRIGREVERQDLQHLDRLGLRNVLWQARRSS